MQDSREINLKLLKKVDIAFSNYSLENGMNKAFYEFAAEEAVMLKDNSMPIRGKENIKFSFMKRADSNINFSWKPLKADVSKSGELGYTYGTYTYKTTDSIYRGTYVSIWKKNEEGEWKYVLDSGNNGLGNEFNVNMKQ